MKRLHSAKLWSQFLERGKNIAKLVYLQTQEQRLEHVENLLTHMSNSGCCRHNTATSNHLALAFPAIQRSDCSVYYIINGAIPDHRYRPHTPKTTKNAPTRRLERPNTTTHKECRLYRAYTQTQGLILHRAVVTLCTNALSEACSFRRLRPFRSCRTGSADTAAALGNEAMRQEGHSSTSFHTAVTFKPCTKRTRPGNFNLKRKHCRREFFVISNNDRPQLWTMGNHNESTSKNILRKYVLDIRYTYQVQSSSQNRLRKSRYCGHSP
jgi:hypothetical protein